MGQGTYSKMWIRNSTATVKTRTTKQSKKQKSITEQFGKPILRIMLRILVKTTATAAGTEAERTEAEVRLETQTAAGPELNVQEDCTALHLHIAGDNVKSLSCMLERKMYFEDILRRAPAEQ